MLVTPCGMTVVVAPLSMAQTDRSVIVSLIYEYLNFHSGNSLVEKNAPTSLTSLVVFPFIELTMTYGTLLKA